MTLLIVVYLCCCSAFLLILSYLVKFFLLKVEIEDTSKRNVLITGCDTGFGNILATLLDERGVRVFAGCLTVDGAKRLQEKTSSRLQTFSLDVTNKEVVAKALATVKAALKDEGLWGLVNNAGVMPTFAPIEWTSMEEYEFTCNVNLFGSISMTKAFLPLVRRNQGRVVNVCSVTSNCGYPGISSYVISKAALKMFSICLRRELLNTGVTVHTIEPGGFETNITSKDRILKAYTDAYTRADTETQDVYGGHVAQYLFKSIQGVTRYVSTNPRQVPDNIVHALFAKYPKQQYLVGQDAFIFFKFMSLVPNWVADYVLGWPRPYGPRHTGFQENTCN